jgi:hypothetical protein
LIEAIFRPSTYDTHFGATNDSMKTQCRK